MKSYKLFTVMLAFTAFMIVQLIAAGNSQTGTVILQKLPGTVHDFTVLPLTEDGWTDFRAMLQNGYADARVIFVSSSEGNDSTGQIYGIGDVTFDANGMFQPQAAVSAYQTIAQAYSQIRAGYPDILLLKRGDEWAERFTTAGVGRAKSGSSITGRHIIASYGTGRRPQLFESVIDTSGASYLIISGIRMYKNGSGKAIDITGSVDHHLYEDLRIDGHSTNRIQGGSLNFSNIAFRRCVFTDAEAHDGFFYASRATNLMFEENVFSKPRIPDNPNTHGRHLYLSPSFSGENEVSLSGVILRRNVFFFGERESLDFRAGGVIDNNLSLQNDVMWVGGRGGSTNYVQSAYVTNNVFLEGTPNTKDSNTLTFFNIDGGAIAGNIWTDNTNVNRNANVISLDVCTGCTVAIAKNIDISDNVIYNYDKHPDAGGRGLQISSGLDEVENVAVQYNDFQYNNGSDQLILHREWQANRFEGFTYIGNRYYTTSSGWFLPGVDLAGWVTASGETDAQAVQVAYPDPAKNIKTYNQLLGGDYDTESFMAEVIQQARHNWRPEYTACAANNYIREGFGKAVVDCEYQ